MIQERDEAGAGLVGFADVLICSHYVVFRPRDSVAIEVYSQIQPEVVWADFGSFLKEYVENRDLVL